MIQKFSRKITLLGCVFCFCAAAYADDAIDAAYNPELEKQLNFRVFLDSREIGYHRVRVAPAIEGKRVSVEANFNVKVLFISAYSYQHSAEEQWKGDCLTSIETETIENGDQFFVRSQLADDGLTIDSHLGQDALTGCIRSFAYWDVNRLDADRLLNTQTGKHVPADISSAGDSEIEIDGVKVPARLYVLRAEDADIKLWYGYDDEWLGLETAVKGGRTLSYVRTSEVADARKI